MPITKTTAVTEAVYSVNGVPNEEMDLDNVLVSEN